MHSASSWPYVPQTHAKQLPHRILVALSIALLAACGGGGGGGGSEAPATAPDAISSASSVTLSGQATFDYVPSEGGKLVYAKTQVRPIRGAALEVVDQAGNLLQRTTTDAQGHYSVTLPADRTVRLRVLAEIDANGVAVNVADNTRVDALYALESEQFSSSQGLADLHAKSGWTGSAYGGPRAAAPFAILDTVYRAQQKVLSVEPAAKFMPLTLHWSEKNKPSVGDLTAGDIGGTFFRRGSWKGDIYVLGAANVDTDEYDESVIGHEWGHYYQWVFSRNDSLGGEHGGEPLEMTTAFAEGWGHGISGIVNERHEMTDTLGADQAQGRPLFLDQPGSFPMGWYSEDSVAQIVYQLGQRLGFAPIHTAMKAMANTPAFTSIFAFSHAVRSSSAAAGDALDPLLSAQNIVTSVRSADPYGSGETNDWGMAQGGAPAEFSVLPIYRRLALGQPSVSCSFGLIGQDKKILKDNKIGNHHFILFDAPAAGRYRLTFKGGLHKDGTYVHPEVSWLERGRRTWHRPNSTEFDLDLQLPSGPTVLSVTDRDVNAGQAEAGCLRVVISNAPVI